MRKNKNSHMDDVTNEILSKGKDVINDFNESESIAVEPKRLENKLISIRLPMAMIIDLRIVARRKGDIGYQQIIKTYISEGLERDNRKAQYEARFQGSFASNPSSESSSLCEDREEYRGLDLKLPSRNYGLIGGV